MALIRLQSWDFASNVQNNEDWEHTQYFTNTTWCSIRIAQGPNSTNAIHVGFNDLSSGLWGLDLRAISGDGPMTGGGVFGQRMAFESTAGGLYGWFAFYDGTFATAQFSIKRASDGTVYLYRGMPGGTQIGGTCQRL